MNLISFKPNRTVEFLCEKEDWGVIPKPYPASRDMPEWFRKLPGSLHNGKVGNQMIGRNTVKKCPPFLDAMTAGWIIPLAADVELHSNQDGSGVTFSTMFYKPVMAAHDMAQISTPDVPHPKTPFPPLKFVNHWIIRLPKGYSALFIQPMNRHESRFTVMSGMVDCDKYFEYINFPFFCNCPDKAVLLKAGTPIVQMIPFKRDTMLHKSNAAAMNDVELERLAMSKRMKQSNERYYKEKMWERK